MAQKKGELGGECARRVCRNQNADMFNKSTRLHYCRPCAKLINKANEHEAQRTYGSDLCVRVSRPLLHVFKTCGNECEGCPVCDGDLKVCVVCNGAESSLPSECPGYRIPAEKLDEISAGKIDYIHGQWHEIVHVNEEEGSEGSLQGVGEASSPSR